MAPVPEGGYRPEDVSADVQHNLHEFDKTYSLLLDQLQAAWAPAGQDSLIHAYETFRSPISEAAIRREMEKM